VLSSGQLSMTPPKAEAGDDLDDKQWCVATTAATTSEGRRLSITLQGRVLKGPSVVLGL
jgi:hypothetical protein